MPYLVTCPEDQSRAVLHSYGPVTDLDAKILGYQHYTEVLHNGDIIDDKEISPVVVALLDEGDEHVNSYLSRIEPEVEKRRPGRPRKDEAAAEATEAAPAEESPLERQRARAQSLTGKAE